MSSVIRLRDYELIRTQSLIGVRERRARSGSIDKARNEITAVFLQGPAEYMFMVDSDMGFPRDALQKMLAVVHRSPEAPIVGGLCFAMRTEGFDEETNAEFFGHIPTISVWKRREEDNRVIAFNTVVDYDRDSLVRCDSTGAAFLLIHRSILERMQSEHGNNWWTKIPHPERADTFGEDTSFFIRASGMDIPLHIHTGIKTSHDKGGIFLTEQTYDQQQELRAHLARLSMENDE